MSTLHPSPHIRSVVRGLCFISCGPTITCLSHQLTLVVRWFWSVRMGSSGRPSTSPLVVTSWPSSPAWKQVFYRGVSWSLPSGPRKARCVTLFEPYSHLDLHVYESLELGHFQSKCKQLVLGLCSFVVVVVLFFNGRTILHSEKESPFQVANGILDPRRPLIESNLLLPLGAKRF